MRKLKIIEHISLDGILQTTSAPGDDFPYGDWTAPYRSPAGLQVVNEMYGKTCDVLLGRRTYDTLASYWPKGPKSPMADRLNPSMKYVVTHRLINGKPKMPTLENGAPLSVRMHSGTSHSRMADAQIARAWAVQCERRSDT
jgi:dihydrofolate reductase